MVKIYTTLEEHKDLLSEKGFFDEDFKPGNQLGMWLKDFDEIYEQTRYQAHADDTQVKFNIDISGNFNYHLDKIDFLLRYRYDPEDQSLALTFYRARFDTEKISNFLINSRDMPEAIKLYEYLSNQVNTKNTVRLFEKIQNQNDREQVKRLGLGF